MQICWSLLCCTILQTAYYVDILVVTLLHNTVESVLCRYLCHYFATQYCMQSTMQISLSLLCCTILQAAYNVDMLVVTLLHNIVDSVLCKYLGHYFAAQYCSLCKMQISWSLLCCTIVQSVYYVDILFITLLHNIAAQYCRRRTIYLSWSLLCCTIMQAAYYVDILVITLLHNIVGRVLCRYVSHYFASQFCWQRTMYIPWSLLCCTILQAAFNVDMLDVTLLHNIVCSVLCMYYLGHYIAAQYCWQRIMQIPLSLLCCTILQAAYNVDMLVVTLLHNIVDSVLCKYLGHYFAAQYCSLCKMQISWSLLCCTKVQSVYYVDILFITLLHNIAAQYCRRRTIYLSWSLLCCTIMQAAYYVDILVITLLHNIVGRVLCRYVSHYFASQFCWQRTMYIPWSLLCCTILQAAFNVDMLDVTLLHNIVCSVLCRYLGYYFAAQYCKQSSMQISQSLLSCTILQAAYYVDILVITFLHNIVGSVLCRYLGHYFAAQYCRQRTMYIY